jgi:drug/metabolite transporter (DMT)-like permease
VAYLLALSSAVLYGTADFLGGLASRQTDTLAVVLRSQGIGLVLLVLMLPVLPEATVTMSDLVWGGVAGLAVSVALPLLFQALAVGRMAVVAPTTAVCAVMIPVVTDLWRGERLAPLTILGVVLAIVAIVLVGQQEEEAASASARPRAIPPGVGLAFVSGVAIGLFFLALAETDARAGMWPLLAVRVVAVTVFGVAALVSGRPLSMAAPVRRIAMASGAFDIVAAALYLLATRYGPLSIAVTLSSLYPASTVILARCVLGERLNGLQVTGVACALLAITLIVGGSLPQ